MLSGMSEPSFLDWYPRGRLAFLATKQSKDLKSRVEFTESVASTLLILLKVKSDLQTSLDAWSFADKNGGLPILSLPSAFHISPNPQDSSRSQVSEESRLFLSFTDYICRFSDEFFSQLVQHPIFQESLEGNPALAGLSGSPVLAFDRAIYTINVGDGIERLEIESFFPPARLDPDLGVEEHSEALVFINSMGLTSALIARDGKSEIFAVVATRPFLSKLTDENKKLIHDFFNMKILSLTRLLEIQALIIKNLADYFTSEFDSSAHLLKIREALWPVSVDVIDT
jgi:hypothetical protein